KAAICVAASGAAQKGVKGRPSGPVVPGRSRTCPASSGSAPGGLPPRLGPRFGLRLESAYGVAIALVSPRQRERRQPGFAPHDPAFVARHQLVRSVEDPEVHLHLVSASRKHGGAAARAEVPPGIVARLAFDGDRIL